MRLDHKVAIITGAGRGIGKAAALRFAEEGASVVLVDIDEGLGNKAVEELQAKGLKSAFYKADVADHGQTEEMARFTHTTFGKIDILVNNAAITRDATLVKMTAEQFNQVIDVNLKGVFNCTRAVVPFMIEANYGRIVNTSSVVGLYGNFGQTNYVGSKAGVIGMTKVWARELGRKGITVNAVAPGFIATEMVATVPEKVLAAIKEKTPLQRLGDPIEIANAYLFLASDDASFITGTVLSVDGGMVG